MTRHFPVCGEGLCIGYDGGDPVSSEYPQKFLLTGAEIAKVVFDVGGDSYVDVERDLAEAISGSVSSLDNSLDHGLSSCWDGRTICDQPSTCRDRQSK